MNSSGRSYDRADTKERDNESVEFFSHVPILLNRVDAR